jgi:alpha-L-rhamnosidase
MAASLRASWVLVAFCLCSFGCAEASRGGTAAPAGTGAAGSGGGGQGGAGASGSSGSAGLGGAAGSTASGAISVTRLRSEYREDPLGIDVARPRLDWLLESDVRGQRQTAYRVLVASTQALLDADDGDLWDSGKVPSDASAQVEYDGSALGSRQRAYWKVQAWDQDDLPSTWSASAFWEMGLLEAGDWQAKWLAAPATGLGRGGVSFIWYPEGDPLTSAPAGERFFRKTFSVPAGAIEGAVCAVTADNDFELFVNGTRVGAETDWREAATFNVQELLHAGDNVIAVRATNVDGPAGLALALDVAQASGTTSVSSDATWKAANSAGGTFMEAAFDDSAWVSAQALVAFGGAPWGSPGGTMPAYFRRDFSPEKTVVRARVYATALGIYELWLNGQRLGIDRLAPGWTDYRERVQVQTYDVTELVDESNTLGAILADGWYTGRIGFLGRSDYFGAGPKQLLVQLELDYDDGTRAIIGGDDTGWLTGTGPLLAADLMGGEIYDARLEQGGWSEPGFADDGWVAPTVTGDASDHPLVADVTGGVQVMEELAAQDMTEIAPGVLIYDLGQNMVGWARLTVQGGAGTTLKMRFAEVLNPDGTLYTENLRAARATEYYTLRGGDEEIYEPRFTTHGFRYLELSGDLDGLLSAPHLDTVRGVVAHSLMPKTGSFATSSELVNQLQSNIYWGQRGNFVSVPTDCPQRDERLGWMGDAQIFVRTATFNTDVAAFYTKWMRDVSDAQTDNGAFTDVSPNPSLTGGTPAWGDAGVIVPWTVYLAYGDTRILEEHYQAMQAWIAYIQDQNPDNLWKNGRGSDFGDWLSIEADTDKEVLATAFYAHSTDLMARIAGVLGKEEDAATYGELFEQIKAAFTTEYITAGEIRSDTQTVYALALRFNLLSDVQRLSAIEQLGADVTSRGTLSTGFIGVAHLLPALSADGRLDLAYQLLNNETFPSWFYSINKGATTIWERWDGIQEDGNFQTPAMNSFNHYSFGAVGEWMYGTIAGIELDELAPGYRHFFVRPQPGGGLTSASAEYDSIRGRIASAWKLEGGVFTLEVTVPVASTAHVVLPYTEGVQESGQPIEPEADGSYAVGSGKYVFTASAP